MLKPLLLLLFVMALLPILYVLFFTTVIDQLLMKRRISRRVHSLESTVASVDDAVRDTMEDLKTEKREVDRALEMVAHISKTPPPVRSHAHTWVIRHRECRDRYWAATAGWVGIHEADRFDVAHHETTELPESGVWYQHHNP
jgi:hypothetical protein